MKIDIINQQISNLQKQKQKLMEDKRIKNVNPYLKKLVGQCYIYENNSYSCPQDRSDYWNEYRQVLEYVCKKGAVYLIFENFSIDSRGHCRYKVEDKYCNKDEIGIPFIGYDELKTTSMKKKRKSFGLKLKI